DPFFVLNSDSFWIEGARPALERMLRAWNGDKMDCLLLICPLDRAVGFDGKGDFSLAPDGRLARKRTDDHSPHIYIGCHLIQPRGPKSCRIGPSWCRRGEPHGRWPRLSSIWARRPPGFCRASARSATSTRI